MRIQKSEQANEFAAIVEVHKALTSPDCTGRRGYLHEYFLHNLAEAIEYLGYNDCVEEYMLNDEKRKRVKLEDFIEATVHHNYIHLDKALRKQETSGRPQDPYHFPGVYDPDQAVQAALMDFDIIGVPYYQGLDAAKAVSGAYRITLAKTQDKLLSYILIQLRLGREPEYRHCYLTLLNSLNLLSEQDYRLFEKVGRYRDENFRARLKAVIPQLRFD